MMAEIKEELDQKTGEADAESLCDIFVADETRERFNQFAHTLGISSDDETLVALLEIEQAQRTVASEGIAWLTSTFEAEGKVQHELRDADVSKTLLDADRDDRVMNELLDIAEQHPRAVSLYLYRRFLSLLAPLMEEFGTVAPLGVIQALLAAYWRKPSEIQEKTMLHEREEEREESEGGDDLEKDDREDVDEAPSDETSRIAPSPLPHAQWPLWWQNRFIKEPDRIVEKARELLASRCWEEVIVGLTITTGRCVSEVLKTGVLFPKNRYSLLFAAYSEHREELFGLFEIPTLVESDLVLEAWRRVRSMVDGRHLSAQEICATYRPRVLEAAVHHLESLMPQDDATDRYTPLLRCIYAQIAARYYCPANKCTEQFLMYVEYGDWSSTKKRSDVHGCAACWQSTYHYVIWDGKDNIDGRQGLMLNQEGVELLECCLNQEEEEEGNDDLEAEELFWTDIDE